MKRSKKRDLVYNMFGGLCAYTGKPLDDTWQIDHVTPKCHYIWYQDEATRAKFGYTYSCNDGENLVPCLRIVNHYKRSLDLEGFRKYIMNLHTRISKLPKKTKVQRTAKRKEYLYEVANLFDITHDKPFSGKFYFESI